MRRSLELARTSAGGAVPSALRAPAGPWIEPPTAIGGLVLWLAIAAAALVGGLGFWTATARIESAVVASGAFAVDGRLRVVQHIDGGLVTEIHVREGQRVRQGDLLMRLDPTMTEAQMGLLEAQLVGALARAARIEAEHDGADDLEIGPDLAALLARDPGHGELVEAQRELLGATRAGDGGEVAILRERSRQLDRQAERLTAEGRTLDERIALAEEDLGAVTELHAEGLTTRPRLLAARDGAADLRGRRAANAARIAELRDQGAELAQQIRQIERDRRGAVAAAREAVREQVLDLRQRLSATRGVHDRLVIRAPESGRVFRLGPAGEGEVVSPGARILEIVPDDATYVIEARVHPRDIDEVRPGGEAKVRLSAYSFREVPPVAGRVRSVSPDRLVDRMTDQPYYAIEVDVSEAELAAIDGVNPMPGMPAEVMVRTGSKTVLTYLFDPITAAMETAMIESD